MNKRNLVFIDTETTGLNSRKHEVIEIAWIVTTPDAETVIETFAGRMLPEHIETAEPRALEINGYTLEKWKAGPVSARGEVAAALHKATMNSILVGHNVSFDEGFVSALMLKEAVVPAWHYHKVDTAAMAWPAFATGKLTGVSLDKVCAFLGIAQPVKHEAAADVASCRAAYRAFMAKYAPVFP